MTLLSKLVDRIHSTIDPKKIIVEDINDNIESYSLVIECESLAERLVLVHSFSVVMLSHDPEILSFIVSYEHDYQRIEDFLSKSTLSFFDTRPDDIDKYVLIEATLG